ncbi:unnamed protein product, partial [Mesorhabditis belari]|uniref:Uncharacterized protein n=1 Tax=Mesorhabditis belari TaxID=2138241 RepID=A0AAF3ESV7_9BILA
MVTLLGSVGYLALAIPVQLFIGPNLFKKGYFSFASLLQCLFFSLAASLLGIFCLRRPESRGGAGSSTTPATQLTRI